MSPPHSRRTGRPGPWGFRLMSRAPRAGSTRFSGPMSRSFSSGPPANLQRPAPRRAWARRAKKVKGSSPAKSSLSSKARGAEVPAGRSRAAASRLSPVQERCAPAWFRALTSSMSGSLSTAWSRRRACPVAAAMRAQSRASRVERGAGRSTSTGVWRGIRPKGSPWRRTGRAGAWPKKLSMPKSWRRSLASRPWARAASSQTAQTCFSRAGSEPGLPRERRQAVSRPRTAARRARSSRMPASSSLISVSLFSKTPSPPDGLGRREGPFLVSSVMWFLRALMEAPQ